MADAPVSVCTVSTASVSTALPVEPAHAPMADAPVSRLPPATAGVALGLCGAGSIVSELDILWSGASHAQGPLICTGMAAAAWLSFSLSRLCSPRVFAAEMGVPSQIAAYGAWQMVGQQLWQTHGLASVIAVHHKFSASSFTRILATRS